MLGLDTYLLNQVYHLLGTLGLAPTLNVFPIKKRLYNKPRTSQFESGWKAYNDLKRKVKKECCKAHISYVLKLIDDKKGNK